MVTLELQGLDALIEQTDPKIVGRSLKRAFQRGLARGKTALIRQVRSEYALRNSDIKGRVHFSNVVLNSGQGAMFRIASYQVPTGRFSPLKAKSGFSVRFVPGRPRVRLRHAFQFPQAGEHRLFAREYNKPKTLPTRGRYKGKGVLRQPVRQLFHRSFVQVADDEHVLEPVQQVIGDASRKEFLRQIGLFGGGQ